MFLHQRNVLGAKVKVTLLALFLTTLLSGLARAQGQYEPGTILLRLTATAVNDPNFLIQPPNSSNNQSGLPELDSALSVHGQSEFRSPLVPPQNTVLAAQLGLDRDYIATVADSTDIETLSQELLTLSDVEFASPNWYFKLATPPNDSLYSAQWGHDNQSQFIPCECLCAGSIYVNFVCCEHEPSLFELVGNLDFDSDIDLAWDELGSFGDANVVIGVLDSGVDPAHPDLLANLLTGFNAIDGSTNTDDLKNHGTKVAGVLAAVANNGIGVAGVAGGCSIMPIQVMKPNLKIDLSGMSNGIIYATDAGVDIISMSLIMSQMPADSFGLEDAVEYAYQQGVTVIAAAGNSSCGNLNYPAAYEQVISVGAASPCGTRKRKSHASICLAPNGCPSVGPASDSCGNISCLDTLGVSCDGEFWWGSNYGVGLDFLAPSMLPTTAEVDSGSYDIAFGGTSSATPVASGIAALLLSKEPTLTPDQIRALMQAGAVDIGVGAGHATAGYDIYTGYGLVNAFNSLKLITVQPPSFVALADYADGSGEGVRVSWPDSNVIETGWTVERKLTSDSIWNVLGTLGENTTDSGSWIDNTASGSESYDYRIKVLGLHVATNPYSPSFSITPLPHVPGNLTTTVTTTLGSCLGGFGPLGSGGTTEQLGPGGGDPFPPPFSERTDQIIVYWSTPVNQSEPISHYILQRTDLSDTSTTLFDRLTGTSYAVCGNALNRGYSFSMWSIDSSGDTSLQSSPVSDITGCLAYCAQGPPAKLATGSAAILPRKTELIGNYPNPFNPETIISYSLARAGHVRITIYNILGQQVVTLIDGQVEAGQYRIRWDGRGSDGNTASSGIYFYRLEANGMSQSRKMLLLK